MSEPPPSPWLFAAAGCAAMATAMGIGRFIYTPLLPEMARSLALDPAAAGWIATTNFAGYLVGCLVLIFWAAGHRPQLLAGGLVASVLSTAAMAGLTDIAVISLVRFVSGLASALVMVAGGAIVLDALLRSGRPVVGGLHWAGVGVGILASVVMIGLTPGLDWRGHWLAAAALAVPLALFALAVLRTGGNRTPPPPTPIAHPIALAVLVVAHTIEGLGYSVYATFVVQLFRDDPQLSGLAGLVWGVVGLGAIPSSLIAAWAARRWGALPSFATGFFIQAAAVAAPVLAPGSVSALVSAFLFGGTLMGITLLAVDAGRSLAGPRGLAIVSVGFAVGQMVGPYTAGLLAAGQGSLDLPTLLSAAGILIGGVIATGLAMVARR